MGTMSREAIDAFLAGPLLARIATVRPDGRPHVVPMWYHWDGQSIFMETGPEFVKARNLRQNPACAITIDVTEGGLRFKGVILEGRAELLDDPTFAREMVDRIYTRYLGPDGIEEPTPRAMRAAPHVIIKLTPTRIQTWDDTGSS